MSPTRVHSRTLFHFTDQAGLMGILQSNFRSSFSKERISLPDGSKWDYWVPMLCFCDIPLHLISDHINRYGQYGMGLSREWALKRKLNPVLYYQPDSLLFDEFNSMMSLQHKDNNGLREQGVLIESTHKTYMKSRYVFQYYKPWFGHDFKVNQDRYFYDEREWRYVPLAEGSFESIYNDDSEFAAHREEYYSKLRDRYLVFEPRDINYIVLHKESERYEMIRKIRDIKEEHIYRDVEALISKIITVEQIESDI